MRAGTAAWHGALLCLVLVLIGIGLSGSASAQTLDPEEMIRDTTMQGNPTTPTGEIIGPIYEKIIWASIAVFLLVGILLTYILIRFRHRRGAKVDVPQIHGNSKLEVAWTIGPALVMFWLLVISYNGLLAIDNPPDAEPEVFIDVVASQFVWSFTYPDGVEVAGQALRLQEETWVQFNVTSTDVIHALAIPGLDVMIDANPGRVNYVTMFAREPGTYLVQCRQYCGTGHGEMLSAVEIFEEDSQSVPFGQPPRDVAPEEPPAGNGTGNGTDGGDNGTDEVTADVTIDVSAFEYGFNPAPLEGVEPGQVVQFVLSNDGQAPHNLFVGSFDRQEMRGQSECVDPLDETTCASTAFIVPAGATDSFVVTMPDEPIAFDVWCDIPGHAEAGMLTYLSVGGAEPDLEVFQPRLPGPGFALVLAGIVAAVLVARRRA